MGGNIIMHWGRTPEDMAMGGNQGERPKNWKLGQNGGYNEGRIPGQTHPGVIGMDNNGTHP